LSDIDAPQPGRAVAAAATLISLSGWFALVLPVVLWVVVEYLASSLAPLLGMAILLCGAWVGVASLLGLSLGGFSLLRGGSRPLSIVAVLLSLTLMVGGLSLGALLFVFAASFAAMSGLH
jgi:hypothetical protein